MSVSGTKLTVFFLGIFIGLIAGIILALWLNNIGWGFSRISGYFKSKFEKQEPVQNAENFTADTAAVKIVNKSTRLPVKNKESFSPETDSLSYEEFSALYDNQLPDSVLEDAYRLYQQSEKTEVVVAKDELLAVKIINVTGIPDKTELNLDSLLLDDRSTRRPKNLIHVEFWKSPINYQGFRWDNLKLVLFGIYDTENLRIKFLNNHYYLQSGNNFYHLEPTETFVNFIPVIDKEVLKQLRSL